MIPINNASIAKIFSCQNGLQKQLSKAKLGKISKCFGIDFVKQPVILSIFCDHEKVSTFYTKRFFRVIYTR